MAKYHGLIGYAEQVETAPGVYTEVITEREYSGDVLRNIRRLERGEGLNDDLNVNNSLSIVADAYATKHFFSIRYATWMGAKWKVTSAEANFPRLVLTLGGLYNA